MNHLVLFAIAIVGIGAYLGTEMAGVATPEGAGRAASVTTRPSDSRSVALRSDARGHFVTDVQMNGQFVKVLVDTGASVVALSAADARKAGIEPPADAYRIPLHTANGMVRGAPARVNELRLGSILVRDVEAVVLPDRALSGTLLGMSFLKKLQSFEMRGGSLVLTQ